MAKRVIIIGGGFSGLAAGVALSERDFDVSLLERRKFLGGRAYSFIDSQSGDVVDNGQHLFMGCYHETIKFLEKIGSSHKLKFQERARVDFLDSAGISTFACPPLPAPLHLLVGLAKLPGLSAGDKLRALKMGPAIHNGIHEPHASLTVDQWLDIYGQSARIRERFWNPLVVATLNEKPAVASALMLKRVLQGAFTGRRHNSSIGISAVGLSELYTTDALRFIQSHGGSVRTGAQAAGFMIEGGRVKAIQLKNGEQVTGDYFISAVPHNALLDLLPPDLRTGEFAPLARLETSPIVSINLWFDRRVLEAEFAGALGTNIQWIFNKNAAGRKAGDASQLAVIISAAREFVDYTKETMVEMTLKELGRLIPATRSARLLRSQIVKEYEATIAHTVESDRLRPGVRTSIPNLILAGDWTDTGLPATIESAVLSGTRAARTVETNHNP